MSEINTLANSLRNIARISSENSGISRTKLEKLATIALIHEHLPKNASAGRTAALIAGLTVPGTLSGIYGYRKGRETGLQSGRQEMYEAAGPYVRNERRRARAAEAMARLANKYYSKKMQEKGASAKNLLYGGAALAIPAATYFGGQHFGKSKGKKSGQQEVAKAAIEDIQRSRDRAARAGQYIGMLRHRYRQLQQAKKGGGS